ncbi:MAG TPA: sulfotransferase [Stellaceae bacterium]|nr:sulfotransferase [Stellaceae bacterium]
MIDNTPFFIIGSGRSGTTLLRLILARHSRLHIPPETWFLRDLVAELPLSATLTPSQVERAVAIMTTGYRWPDMGIRPEELRGWAMALERPKLVDVVGLVYRFHLERAGKVRFGDKTPIYFDIVPQLATLYPGAKFIHLIRDGRDVAISWINLNYDRYYERPGFEWTSVMARRQAYVGGPHWQQIIEIKYEDLVADLEVTVRKICRFLGEEFEPGMLDYQEGIELVPARERHIHGKLGQPVTKDSIGLWRSKLSALECFAMESCLSRDLQDLGYELRFSGAAWRPLLDLTGRFLYTVAPLLGRTVRYLRRRNLLQGVHL